MTKTLALAIKKVGELPKATQEEIGLELLERVDTLAWLRAEIEIGMQDIRAGKFAKIDAKSFIKEMRKRHAKKGR